MDLEQRVRALEQELEILKGQIQATLLDIQEQLLNNAFSTLRSAEATPPKASATGHTTAQKLAAIDPDPAPAPDPAEDAPKPIHRFSLEAREMPSDDSAEPPEPSSKVRVVAVKRPQTPAPAPEPEVPITNGASDTHAAAIPKRDQDSTRPRRPADDQANAAGATSPRPKTARVVAARAPKRRILEQLKPEARQQAPSELTPEAEHHVTAEDMPDDIRNHPRNTVLRLIAGLYNVDVDKKWNKRNG